MTIWSSTQNPHILKTMIAAMNGLGQHQVRAIAPEVGGGFGAKINIYAEEYVCSVVSKNSACRSSGSRIDRRLRRDDARPRHHRLHRRGRAQGRQGAQEDAADCRHRRLQHAAHRGDPDADDVDGQRHLRHPGDSHDADGGLHQQDADRRVSRRRPSRSDLLRRARDGHAGARAEHGSGRAAPEELHQVEPVPVQTQMGAVYDSATTRRRSTPR